MFDRGRDVDDRVREQREHGHEFGDGVQRGAASGLAAAPEQDARRDQERETHRRNRLVVLAASPGEEVQRMEDPVRGERLKDARRADQGAERAGERGGRHAREHEESGMEHGVFHECAVGVFDEVQPVPRRAEEQDLHRVDHEPDADRQDRAARDGFARVLQVAGHVNAREESGHGGEEHCEIRREDQDVDLDALDRVEVGAERV